MKPIKRLLALLLTLALAFALALPALAQDEEPNPAMPVITVQPQGGRIRLYESVTVSIQAHIPNGDEPGYLWHCRYSDGSEESWYGGAQIEIYDAASCYVEVYNKANPEYRVTSATVQVELSWLANLIFSIPIEVIYIFWAIQDFFFMIPNLLILPLLPVMALFGGVALILILIATPILSLFR